MNILGKTKVVQMVSDRTGRAVPNQIEIHTPEGVYFQSYDSVIVFENNGGEHSQPRTYLDEVYWNYSRTTSKYRNQFLGESTEETKKKINAGYYKLVNLN